VQKPLNNSLMLSKAESVAGQCQLKIMAKSKTTIREINLNDPKYYFNRELSWLEFNNRVLHEATDPRTPLLERLKFLAIFSSNLDEFFMVRVAALKQQLEAQVRKLTPDGRPRGNS
jgi:polyphosphate kinase